MLYVIGGDVELTSGDGQGVVPDRTPVDFLRVVDLVNKSLFVPTLIGTKSLLQHLERSGHTSVRVGHRLFVVGGLPLPDGRRNAYSRRSHRPVPAANEYKDGMLMINTNTFEVHSIASPFSPHYTGMTASRVGRFLFVVGGRQLVKVAAISDDIVAPNIFCFDLKVTSDVCEIVIAFDLNLNID